MADRTSIEWTDATVNFWWGCTKVGPGCDHCYAEAWSKRTGGGLWGVGAPRRKIKGAVNLIHKLDNDYSWWAADALIGQLHPNHTRRVFIQSMSDLFDNEVPLEWFDEAWKHICICDRIEIQIVTKRVSIVEKRLAAIGGAWPGHAGLIISVVNQEEADRDIPRLIELKHKLGIPWIGLSMEPLLGAVTLMPEWLAELDWVIVGGESGPHARPMHPDWARRLRNQCAAAGVPFLFKQWGEWSPTGSVDGYWHGPEKNLRQFPNSPGLAWLADGRICMRDFTVAEHQRRIRSGEAHNTRAVEADRDALRDFGDTLGLTDGPLNPLGYQWMYRVGKKVAGRLLDGVQHDGFPLKEAVDDRPA